MSEANNHKSNKPEIRIRHIRGGMIETMETGVYPDYYQVRSRKYVKSWKVKELPASVKFKGEVVYTIESEFGVYDADGNPVESVEFTMEMRD